MMFACPLFYALVLLYCVQSHCGESHGKEPQPKLPVMPKTKEEKKEKDVKESFTACYEGYTLSEKKCIKKIVEEPLRVGNAVKVPYFHRCPPEFDEDKKSNLCSMSVEVPPEYFCPSGWIDNVTNCVIKESPSYTYECPKGKKWKLIDNRCVLVHKAKQIVNSQCPEGAHTEEDGNCWKVLGTYDCTPEKKEKKEKQKKEKKQEESKKDHNKDKLRRLEGEHNNGEKKNHHNKKEKEGEKKEKKVELLKEMQQVSAPKTTKVNVASQQCEKKVMVEPIVLISCPEGFFEVENDECVQEEVTAPNRVCALKKNKNNDECGGIDRETPKVAKCPPGAEKVKDKCIQTTVTSPLNICAVGWKDTGEGCLGQLEDVPDHECRPGLTLVNGQCIGQLVRHPTKVSLKIPQEPCDSKTY